MPVMRKPQPWWNQVFDLFLIELTSWRWAWRGFVIIGTVTPLLSMLALSVFARDSGEVALTYIFCGNIVLSLMFGLQNNIQSHFQFMRMNGVLAYFATLPVGKMALVVAVLLAFFVLNLPSLLVMVGVGAWLLDIPLQVSGWLLLVIPLCTLPMAGIGALIGTISRNPQESGAYSLLLSFLMMGLGSVVIPPERLPAVLVQAGLLNPATYAASALRQVLVEGITAVFYRDVLVLLLCTVVVFGLLNRYLDWRE